jgi:hypothetical protein
MFSTVPFACVYGAATSVAAVEGRRRAVRYSVYGGSSGPCCAAFPWRLRQVNVMKMIAAMRRKAPAAAMPAIAGTESWGEVEYEAVAVAVGVGRREAEAKGSVLVVMGGGVPLAEIIDVSVRADVVRRVDVLSTTDVASVVLRAEAMTSMAKSQRRSRVSSPDGSILYVARYW